MIGITASCIIHAHTINILLGSPCRKVLVFDLDHIINFSSLLRYPKYSLYCIQNSLLAIMSTSSMLIIFRMYTERWLCAKMVFIPDNLRTIKNKKQSKGYSKIICEV